jgi:hypothetical protein
MDTISAPPYMIGLIIWMYSPNWTIFLLLLRVLTNNISTEGMFVYQSLPTGNPPNGVCRSNYHHSLCIFAGKHISSLDTNSLITRVFWIQKLGYICNHKSYRKIPTLSPLPSPRANSCSKQV